jgi:hypothetical protein
MKTILILFLLAGSRGNSQQKVTITKYGWLAYTYFDDLAFFPIKDQSKVPTYKNFFSEEKDDGQRMNNSNSAQEKLLISKIFKIRTYEHDFKHNKDTFAGKRKFYIQPVKYVYQTENTSADSSDHENGFRTWTFLINNKPTIHWIYKFNHRSGRIYYLNTKDSLFAQRGGRRKEISIYPPH